MQPYRIITVSKTAFSETEVTLIGPGLHPAGERRVFPNRERAGAYVDALNFAFAQGVHEGLELARLGGNGPESKEPGKR